MLFGTCIVRKATVYVDKKEFNMCHQAQKGFRGIFIGILQHQKGYVVYVLSIRKIISPYDVVFNESFSSTLAYTLQHYAEGVAMRPEVSYIPCATSSK